MRAPSGLCLLALLACWAAAAVLQVQAATVLVGIKGVVEVRQRNVLPTWKVAPTVLPTIIPESLRNSHRMVYRFTTNYVDLAKICIQLHKGNTVRLNGTVSKGEAKQKKTASEVVNVRKANSACTGMKVIGTKAAAMIQILVQKKLTKTIKVENSWNVIQCPMNAAKCKGYRLSKPCFRGRCSVDPDKTLYSGVFSSVELFNLTSLAQVKGTIEYLITLVNANTAQSMQILRDYFINWQDHEGVEYDTQEAIDKAFAAFVNTIKIIDELIKQGKAVTWLPGFTPYSDMPKSQFVDEILMDRSGFPPKPPVPSPGRRLTAARGLLQASSIDWRNGKVTSVKNQGRCGSCWAFASIAAIESAVLIHRGLTPATTILDLSEQQITSCAKSNGCGGGWLDTTLKFAQIPTDLVQEGYYPYYSGGDGVSRTCETGKSTTHAVRTNSGTTYRNYYMSTLKSLLANGPVAVAMDATNLGGYGSGIFTNCNSNGGTINHAVLVVGYTPDWWIVKNSWGTGWGESGYFRLPMWDTPHGPCNIYVYQVQIPTATWTSGVNPVVPPPVPPPSPPCFPGGAMVQLADGQKKRMDELAVGDSVLAADSSTGSLTHQPVYFFGHRLQNDTDIFVEIETDSVSLRLTPDHYLPVCDQGPCTDWAEFTNVPAHSVRSDQTVMLHQGTNNVSTAKVMHVRRVTDVGKYNPYTTGGYIVVDGVVASVHSSWILDGVFQKLGVSLPTGYQVAFAPLRALYSLIGASNMELFQTHIIDRVVDWRMFAPVSVAMLSVALAMGLKRVKA